MKKVLSLLLAVCFIFTMLAVTSCGDEKNPDDTKDTTPADTQTPDTQAPDTQAPDTQTPETQAPDTQTPQPVDEPNMFPYSGDVIPGSVDWDWGAPDAESVYFSIDDAHIIHDGKGTWSNAMSCIGTAAFDCDPDTFYDCDEGNEYANGDDIAYGIAGDGSIDSGYVGAWIEGGVKLTQIRFFARSGDATINARPTGCKFQASVDGTEWTDVAVIEEQPAGGDYAFFDIDDDTVYYYVRFLGRSHEEYPDSASWSYVNIAEFEIWGVPANK